MKATKESRTVKRETSEDYRGRPMCIEVGPDGVFVWPRGRREKVMISLVGAYERALAHQAGIDPSPPKRQLGMSPRRYKRTPNPYDLSRRG